MNSFISQTLDEVLKTTKSFDDVVFILPSQRAKVFLKQTIKEKISIGFLPETLSIEQFIEQVSEIKKADSVQLLFDFYSVYKSLEKNADSFDVFSSWAFTVLQDFNELDQHLINTKEIFIYLRDIQRLKKWSVTGTFQETEFMKDHYLFLEKLHLYYPKFYNFLKDRKKGYQGLMYRESCVKIDNYLEKNNHKKFIFLGFNALNKAEELLFQKVLGAGNSDIYWDLDSAFLNSNHQAGAFIRKYKKEWKYYEKNTLKTIGNNFSETKNIQVIGASKNTTQIKYAGEILEKFANFNNTALVLADETLLPITLNSLPKNINAINITMGYPLKDIPTTSLFHAIFQLFISQERLQKKAVNEFYYKDIIRFLKHQSVYGYLTKDNSSIVDDFTESIAKNNDTFITVDKLNNFLKQTTIETHKVIISIFDSFRTIDQFLNRVLQLINLLRNTKDSLEKEFLYRYHTVFTQLKTLQDQFSYFTDLKTLSLFFNQLVGSESLSFQGEPLKGLQLMGMLETRVLDFENIILTSTNEGVLPASAQQNSFIPFDVKVAFGLPTYKEKDAIFSYHFFRLLQRAKNVFIIYNTEHDVFGSGEKSRFVTQLEMIRQDVSQKLIAPKIVLDKKALKKISKDKITLDRLKNIASTGFSPSSITNYLYNPVSFYQRKILKIKEFDDVEETVAFNTLGTVVHKTLDALYKPNLHTNLSVAMIVEMESKAKNLVINFFKTEFKNGDLSTGKNRLIFEVANRFVSNFLSQEKALLLNPKNTLKVIATEVKLSTEINIKELPFPVKLNGEIDRIDELNGTIRIIDYKTGMVSTSNLKVPTFTELRDEKYHKAVQVLLYAILYTRNKNHNFNKPLKAGIYSFKNLNNGFLPVNFSKNTRKQDLDITPERLDEFLAEIKQFIIEIYNPEIPFIEPEGLKY